MASRELQAQPGSYALILECRQPARVEAGALGLLEVLPGWYVYIGSAFGPGGVRARCLRHCRGGRPHWHIDYLRPLCRLQAVWFTHDPLRREHQWAKLMARTRGAGTPFPGFGSSDCGSPSHLFLLLKPPSFAAFKRRVYRDLKDHGPAACWVPSRVTAAACSGA